MQGHVSAPAPWLDQDGDSQNDQPLNDRRYVDQNCEAHWIKSSASSQAYERFAQNLLLALAKRAARCPCTCSRRRRGQVWSSYRDFHRFPLAAVDIGDTGCILTLADGGWLLAVQATSRPLQNYRIDCSDESGRISAWLVFNAGRSGARLHFLRLKRGIWAGL